MSLDVTFTLEDLVEQLGKYKKQLVDTENAVQQIKGAIAACEHQMQLLVMKQNQYISNKAAQGAKENATEEGEQPENNLSEHQDGDCSRETAEASSSNCLEQSGEVNQQQQERVQII